jgi:hypothetical protein
MVHCKNTEGGPGDVERCLPHLIEQEKAKGTKKTFTKKKRKRGDIEAERVAAVAATAERAERGGRGTGVRIGNQLSQAQRATVEELEAWHGSPHGTIMLGGRCVSLEDAPKGPHAEESQA